MPRIFAVIAVSLAGALLLSAPSRAGEGRPIARLLEALARTSSLPEREIEALLLERFNARLASGLRDRVPGELRAGLAEARSLGELERMGTELQRLVAADLAADRVLLTRLSIDEGFALTRETFLAEDLRPGFRAVESSVLRAARGNPVSEELARQALRSDAVFFESTGIPLLGPGCESVADDAALRRLRDISEGMSARAERLGRGASAEALDGALEGAAADALGASGGELWRDRLCRLILVCRVFDSSFGRARCR